MRIIEAMSDEKPKPLNDLKEGLGLIFRAAKGAVESLPTDKVENIAKDGAKELARTFESLGNEVEKLINPNKSNTEPPPAANAGAHAPPPEPPKEEVKYDDGYAPEPPKGPRVG